MRNKLQTTEEKDERRFCFLDQIGIKVKNLEENLKHKDKKIQSLHQVVSHHKMSCQKHSMIMIMMKLHLTNSHNLQVLQQPPQQQPPYQCLLALRKPRKRGGKALPALRHFWNGSKSSGKDASHQQRADRVVESKSGKITMSRIIKSPLGEGHRKGKQEVTLTAASETGSLHRGHRLVVEETESVMIKTPPQVSEPPDDPLSSVSQRRSLLLLEKDLSFIGKIIGLYLSI